MKKYLVLGIVVTVAAILLSFPGNPEPEAADVGVAFSGTVEGGRQVWALGTNDYQGVVNDSANTYYIRIPSWDTGWYCVTDGCQHFNRCWNGRRGQIVNFNVPQTGPCN